MRQVTMTGKIAQSHIPRGWVILGLAVGCWALVIATGVIASNLFSFISAAVFA